MVSSLAHIPSRRKPLAVADRAVGQQKGRFVSRSGVVRTSRNRACREISPVFTLEAFRRWPKAYEQAPLYTYGKIESP